MKALKLSRTIKLFVLSLGVMLISGSAKGQTYELFTMNTMDVYEIDNVAHTIKITPDITKIKLLSAISVSDGGTIKLLDGTGGSEIFSPDTLLLVDTMVVLADWTSYSHTQEYDIIIGPKVKSSSPLIREDNAFRTSYLYGTIAVGKGSEVGDLLSALIVDDGNGVKEIYKDATLSAQPTVGDKLQTGMRFKATSQAGIVRVFNISVDNYFEANFSVNDFSTLCGLVDSVRLTNMSYAPLQSQFQWYLNGELFSNNFEPAAFVLPAGKHTIRMAVMDKYGSPIGDKYHTPIILGTSGSFIVSTGDQACPNSKVAFETKDGFTNNTWIIQGIDTLYNVSFFDTSFVDGTYTIQLVNNFAQCAADTMVRTLTVTNAALPFVEAGVSTNKVCPGDEINFFPVNTYGEGYTYDWVLSDGSIYSDREVFRGLDPTTWLGWAVLNVTNSCGNFGKDTVYVDVVNNLSPQLTFTSSSSNNCPEVPFDFWSETPGTKIWDFGDGTSAVGSKVSHVYANEGYYTVKLLITNSCGKSTMGSLWVDVMKTFGTIPNPVIGFANEYELNDTLKILPGKTLKFINNSGLPGQAINYKWEFGDGAVVQSNLKEVSHTFSDTITFPTTFKVKLTAEATCGGISSDSVVVVVHPSFVPAMNIMVLPEVACTGDPIYVVDENTKLKEIGVTYDVDFGDGTVLYGITVPNDNSFLAQHSYSFESTFGLTVTINNGTNTSNMVKNITIANDPLRKPFYHIENTTDFSKGPGQLYYYTAYHSVDSTAFIGLSSLYDTSGTYEVGFVINGNKQVVSSGTYSRDAFYINLTATGGACIGAGIGGYNYSFGGGYHTISTSILSDACSERMLPMSKGSYTLIDLNEGENKRAACVSDTVYFKVYGGNVLEWNFGDGQTGAGQIAIGHKYSSVGYYDAYARVQNACGRVDTLYTPVEITSNPNPKFDVKVSNYSPFVDDTVKITVEADSVTTKNYTFSWTYFVDSTFVGLTKDIVFTKSGAHTIGIEAHNSCGSFKRDLPFVVRENAFVGPRANVTRNFVHVFGGNVFELNASGSTNSGGGSTGLIFEWQVPAGFTVLNPGSPIARIVPVDNVVQSTMYYIKLIVKEGPKEAIAVIDIVVKPKVMIIAGPDITLIEGEAGYLDGSDSYGEYFGHIWTADEGIQIQYPDSLKTQFIAPKVNRDTWFKAVLDAWMEASHFSDTLWILVKNIPDEIIISNAGDDNTGNGSLLSPYKTIQKGVDVAADSSTIVLMDGLYSGAGNTNINILNKSLWITSLNGYKLCKIDGQNSASYIAKYKNTSADSIGLRIEGIGFMNIDSALILTGSKISTHLLNNRFDSCSNSITLDSVAKAKFERNIFNVSSNYAFRIKDIQDVMVSNNTFNQCDTALIFEGLSNMVYLKNNIIVNGDWAVYALGSISSGNGFYNDIWNMTGGTYFGTIVGTSDISVDPVFMPNNSFRLTAGSPCINAGVTSEYDEDGSVIDIGAIPTLDYEFRQQEIYLKAGWNIFSLGVMPTNPSMMQLVQPLIDANKLVKVQDQQGNSIEYISTVWEDNIGNINDVQGYKIKVTSDTVLHASGLMAQSPVIIPYKTGWNISGFPSLDPSDIMVFTQPLMDEGSLIKVQSQTGTAFEFLSGIGWVNHINVLTPGQGYRVKVSFNTQFVHIDEYSPLTNKSSVSSVAPGEIPKPVKLSDAVFNPSWVGYGLDHMNVFINTAQFNGLPLEDGDMIGVFDNEVCVGVYTVPANAKYPLNVKATKDDPTTSYTDGFKAGNTLKLKVWRKDIGAFADEVQVAPLSDSYNLSFTSSGTTVIDLTATKNTTDIIPVSILDRFNLFPNPANEEVNINFSISKVSNVSLEVVNLLGQRVASLHVGILSEGDYKTNWDCRTANGYLVENGVYLVNMYIDGDRFTKKLMIVR